MAGGFPPHHACTQAGREYPVDQAGRRNAPPCCYHCPRLNPAKGGQKVPSLLDSSNGRWGKREWEGSRQGWEQRGFASEYRGEGIPIMPVFGP